MTHALRAERGHCVRLEVRRKEKLVRTSDTLALPATAAACLHARQSSYVSVLALTRCNVPSRHGPSGPAAQPSRSSGRCSPFGTRCTTASAVITASCGTRWQSRRGIVSGRRDSWPCTHTFMSVPPRSPQGLSRSFIKTMKETLATQETHRNTFMYRMALKIRRFNEIRGPP